MTSTTRSPLTTTAPSYGDLCYRQRTHRAQCNPAPSACTISSAQALNHFGPRPLGELDESWSQQSIQARTSLVVQWVASPSAKLGDKGLIPGPEDSVCGEVPQLLKPVCPRAHALQQEKPPQWQACAWQLESSPPLASTRASPRAAMKTQHSQKFINF